MKARTAGEIADPTSQALEHFEEPTVLLVDEVGGDEDLPQVIHHKRIGQYPMLSHRGTLRCLQCVHVNEYGGLTRLLSASDDVVSLLCWLTSCND